LELYVKKTICGHEGQLLTVGAGLLGAGKVELELFSTIDLDRLLRTPGLRLVCVCWVGGWGSLYLAQIMSLPSTLVKVWSCKALERSSTRRECSDILSKNKCGQTKAPIHQATLRQ
jgi:hypothetical protein